jgi:hypothetical protein
MRECVAAAEAPRVGRALLREGSFSQAGLKITDDRAEEL